MANQEPFGRGRQKAPRMKLKRGRYRGERVVETQPKKLPSKLEMQMALESAFASGRATNARWISGRLGVPQPWLMVNTPLTDE